MATAHREGNTITVTFDIEEAQALRVALQPCACRSTKSHSTTAIRERFVRGIGMALLKKPGETHQA